MEVLDDTMTSIYEPRIQCGKICASEFFTGLQSTVEPHIRVRKLPKFIPLQMTPEELSWTSTKISAEVLKI